MSTITKDQKQAVRWMLDGLDVEASIPDQGWEKLEKTVANDSELGALVRGAWGERWEFRLKPRTVKVGNREIEAPVLDPVEGQELWACDPDGTCGRLTTFTKGYVELVVDAGRAFASSEAARAAHAAITALMRGEA